MDLNIVTNLQAANQNVHTSDQKQQMLQDFFLNETIRKRFCPHLQCCIALPTCGSQEAKQTSENEHNVHDALNFHPNCDFRQQNLNIEKNIH